VRNLLALGATKWIRRAAVPALRASANRRDNRRRPIVSDDFVAAVRSPLIAFAEGQIWRSALDGSERRISKVRPAHANLRAMVQFRSGDRTQTQTQLSMRAWIGRNKAQLVPSPSPKGPFHVRKPS
jgi:hypothetical protein